MSQPNERAAINGSLRKMRMAREFLRDRVDFSRSEDVWCKCVEIFDEYCRWCVARQLDHHAVCSGAEFGQAIQRFAGEVLCPVSPKQVRFNGARVRIYVGCRIRQLELPTEATHQETTQ